MTAEAGLFKGKRGRRGERQTDRPADHSRSTAVTLSIWLKMHDSGGQAPPSLMYGKSGFTWSRRTAIEYLWGRRRVGCCRIYQLNSCELVGRMLPDIPAQLTAQHTSLRAARGRSSGIHDTACTIQYRPGRDTSDHLSGQQSGSTATGNNKRDTVHQIRDHLKEADFAA